ncbi:MAG: ATP-grasp domain-containing protein [Planctomycetota bacterium]
MMKPTWLIEANVQGLPSEALQAEIRRQGMEVHVVKPFLHAAKPGDILGAESVGNDSVVLFTGTLTLMKYIQAHRRWRPGGWCNFENLACSRYYAHFGEAMLNRDYALLPFAEAARSENRLFEHYGQSGQIFVRPDSVGKSFSGKLISRDSYSEFTRATAIDATDLVMVAKPLSIACEWRLFIRQGRVIAKSQYRRDGRTDVSTDVPQDVVQYAEGVLDRVPWRPDPLFVIDVGESGDSLKIVELNSFSCSGQCAIDLEHYVAAASESAMMYT